MMSEPHVAGSEMGELQRAMWIRQFTALRDGDRFFYGNDPVLRLIRGWFGIDYRVTLAQLISEDTGIAADELPEDVFFAPPLERSWRRTPRAGPGPRTPPPTTTTPRPTRRPRRWTPMPTTTRRPSGPRSPGTRRRIRRRRRPRRPSPSARRPRWPPRRPIRGPPSRRPVPPAIRRRRRCRCRPSPVDRSSAEAGPPVPGDDLGHVGLPGGSTAIPDHRLTLGGQSDLLAHQGRAGQRRRCARVGRAGADRGSRRAGGR